MAALHIPGVCTWVCVFCCDTHEGVYSGIFRHDAGILSEPMLTFLSIIPKEQVDIAWLKIPFDSLYLTPLVNTLGPGSVPVDHVYDAGILPEPMLTSCQIIPKKQVYPLVVCMTPGYYLDQCKLNVNYI